MVLEASAVADLGLARGLPVQLQSAGQVALVWGGSWLGNAGNGRWVRDEASAADLLTTDDVSQHCLAWNAALRRFVLLRWGWGGIVAQFSTMPWGPLSARVAR